MKRFLFVFPWTALAMLTTFTACTFTQQNVVPLAQKVVKQYCAVPEAERLLIRGQVNQAIAPDSIVVTCTPPANP